MIHNYLVVGTDLSDFILFTRIACTVKSKPFQLVNKVFCHQELLASYCIIMFVKKYGAY